MGTLNFLCSFALPPAPFFVNQSDKSRSWWAPSTFSVRFHGLSSFFWRSKWQIKELVGTLSFLCAFSTRRQIFCTSNWQIQELVGTLIFLCGFSIPLPKFFGNGSVSPGVGGHAQLSHSPPHFFEMEVRNPGGSGHPQVSVCLVTPSPSFFWKSK